MRIKRAGFTLIEVILVLAALSTVTAIAVPNYTSRLQESKVKADIVQMDTLLSDFQLNQIVPEYAYRLGSTLNASMTPEGILQSYVDDLFDATSSEYMADLYSPDTEETLVLEEGVWVSVYKAETDGDHLWLSNRTTGTESDGRVRIPDSKTFNDKYTEGENITWGDTLLYIGDRENLESRFSGLTCDNFVMESQFYYDNHVHQDKDHKSYYGVVFNYVDDDNFFMVSLRLKNGSKKFDVFEIKDGNWTEVIKGMKLPNDFNPSGNGDFAENIDYETKIQVDNSADGASNVTFWIKKKSDPSYYEVFDSSFSVEEEQKSQRYGFYIGDPLVGSKLKAGGEIAYITPEQDELYVFGDETTYINPEVQIQLDAYPSASCVGQGTPPPPPPFGDDWEVTLAMEKGKNKKWTILFSMNEEGTYDVNGTSYSYDTPNEVIEIYKGKDDSMVFRVWDAENEINTNVPNPLIFVDGEVMY
ncbi:hypothetical protein SANA_31230 [Gottschalkiaceae bacterium SANA]|nr:hypothetical protein SANA_31230 [Gottschalkiaceae bacterium SANA]